MIKYLLIITTFLANSLHAKELAINLNPEKLKYVSFEDIPETIYSFSDETLKAHVKSSSSFMLLPFSEIKNVIGFKFNWKQEGQLKVNNSKMEQSKKGDDFAFRLGLILSGKEPFVPFFAPGWIKAIKKHAKLPSDKIVYYVAGSKSAPGSKWESPYSGSIDYVSVASKKEKIWQAVNHKLDKTSKVVGLWIMADGDNSKSNFKVEVKNLSLMLK